MIFLPAFRTVLHDILMHTSWIGKGGQRLRVLMRVRCLCAGDGEFVRDGGDDLYGGGGPDVFGRGPLFSQPIEGAAYRVRGGKAEFARYSAIESLPSLNDYPDYQKIQWRHDCQELPVPAQCQFGAEWRLKH